MSQAPTPGNAHVICLRRPWRREPFAAAKSKLLAYTRRFGAPGNLTASDRVELVAAGIERLDGMWLNGSQIEVDLSADPVRVDITRQLVARNELQLVIQPQPRDMHGNSQPVIEAWQDAGAVRLEIHQRP